MHATELPKPFHRAGWVYEEKYDGWRMVAEKVGSQVTLTSRFGEHAERAAGGVSLIFHSVSKNERSRQPRGGSAQRSAHGAMSDDRS